MAEWFDPTDWITGQKIRARDLNRNISYNIAWLKDRPISIATFRGQSAEAQFTNTTWATLGELYQLSLYTPARSSVMLYLMARISAGSTNHNMYFDWVRDGRIWLSTATGNKPADTGASGLTGVFASTSVDVTFPIIHWDMD